MDYKIRTILAEEDSSLKDFLYKAIFVLEGVPAPPPKSIINQPELQVYIAEKSYNKRYQASFMENSEFVFGSMV